VTNDEVNEIKQHIDERFSLLRAEFDSVRREAGVAAEGLRSEIRQVAEGVALANERIDDVDLRVDRLATETRRGFADLRAEVRRATDRSA
jgi:hypothetical protein